MEMIKSREDCVEKERSNSYGNDLLCILLDEMKKEGGSLNLQLVMDECKTFFFAGHETTALLLTWTVMLLATNSHWQDKVRAEIKHIFKGETPSLDKLSKLTLVSSKYIIIMSFIFHYFIYLILYVNSLFLIYSYFYNLIKSILDMIFKILV